MRRPVKRAATPAKGFKTQLFAVRRPHPTEFSGGVDVEEALAVGESLDEQEKRG